jgi:hypothetical protein
VTREKAAKRAKENHLGENLFGAIGFTGPAVIKKGWDKN